MIFSYGFLERSVTSARQLFLALDIPDDDPLRLAKKRICANSNIAPGLRLAVGDDGKTKWESEFIYWACVNEEDGLSFELMQTNEGPPELRVSWKGKEEIATAHVSGETSSSVAPAPTNFKSLRTALSRDPQWEIYQLRAAVLIQQSLQSHLDMLGGEMEQAFENVEHDLDGSQSGVRSYVYDMIRRLRNREVDLLTRGLGDVYREVSRAKLVDAPRRTT